MPLNQEDISLALRTAVPIDDIDRMMLHQKKWLAVIWLDIQDRPDMLHLAERHKKESGYCVCTWFYGNQGEKNMIIGLHVEMHQPTRTVFNLVFKVTKYIDQLEAIATGGMLWILPGPPPNFLRGTLLLSAEDIINKIVNQAGGGVHIELEEHMRAELASQLATWKRGKK